MRQDSLHKRYAYKMVANTISFFIGALTQAIIPRGLGPVAYGNFNFLANFFTQITGFLDSGTSTCFYTKLSSRHDESGLVSFYLYFIGIVALVILGFVAVALLSGLNLFLWPGQRVIYVLAAMVFAILAWVNQVCNSMTDARGLTVPSEVGRVAQKFFAAGLICAIYFLGRLNLGALFVYHYLVLSLWVIVCLGIMSSHGYALKQGWKLRLSQIRLYAGEFYQYSHPLFLYSFFVLAVGLFDRWLLQIVGGSLEQGLYSLSYQIGALCFLFTGAFTPLIMREFSIAHHEQNTPRIAALFRNYASLLFAVTAYFACFAAAQAQKIVLILGGAGYNSAVLAATIMAFYPIHQVYGQLNGSVFYATGKTKLYSGLAIIFLIAGLPLTYFLIAPKSMWGLNAGACGLAVKMVLINVVDVNVQFYFIAKLLKLNYGGYLRNQFTTIFCLFAAAWVIAAAVDRLSRGHYNFIVSFVISGIAYTAVAAAIGYFFPGVFGIDKAGIKQLIRGIV